MAQRFMYKHRVTYAECTLGNHVYYGRYLELLEAARGAFFRQVSRPFLDWQNEGIIFPVVECHLRYRGAARYDDTIRIAVWIDAVARSRVGFGYVVSKSGGADLVVASTLHVCTSLEDKPRRLPEDLEAALRPYYVAG